MNTEGKTIGEILRSAREDKSLTVEQVNRETRIPIPTLHALEQDDFGSLPNELYLKGFLRNYAEFLGLDGARLWSMVNQRAASATSAPAWDIEATREEKLGPPRIMRRLVVPVLFVLVVALAILLLRERRRAGETVGQAPAARASGAMEVL